MKKRDLEKIGIPRGEIMDAALQAVIKASRADRGKREIITVLRGVVERPLEFKDDPIFGECGRMLARLRDEIREDTNRHRAPLTIWGSDLDKEAIAQIERACELPVAVRGALMPDAHVGYGLPIGGVLAVKNAVIPYAVGVDIACRMKLTVFDMPVKTIENDPGRLKDAILQNTLFGVGGAFRKRRQHPVMDMDWNVSPVTSRNKDAAWGQLGTSGSGNHFVEFGALTVDRSGFDLPPGAYLALLSHSGSRGTGSKVASYYSKLAMQKRLDLGREYRQLAWLELSSHEGREYWTAMQLMGSYAAANHAVIHERIAEHLGSAVLYQLENHHNFAWKEEHDGEEVVVHRKGATPASAGARGIIPGSMASPGFIVQGLGERRSLCSASHGAGRRMSRSAARQQFNWNDARPVIDAAGVTVIAAGIDEAPMAYKDIAAVMAAQKDLVETVARFDPKIVAMAPSGERAED